MKSCSVLKSHVTGFGRRSARAMLFGLAAVVPVISMGITVPSALGLRGAQKAFDEESSRLDLKSSLLGRLGDYTQSGSLDELGELASVLRGMVPCGVRPLEEFALIRAIAARSGVDMESIQSVRTHSAMSLAESKKSEGDAAQGEEAAAGIVIDEVLVTFNGGIDFCLQLVSTLRESGYPIIVFGFDLARAQAGTQNFAVELRLGFLRRLGA